MESMTPSLAAESSTTTTSAATTTTTTTTSTTASAVVAVVSVVGPIMDGRSPPGPPWARGSTPTVYGDDLSDTLRQLRRDPQICSVVLRINSPGGSADASEKVAREVEALRHAGKAVICSLGDVAASGGYYIAALADTIYAMPGTLTGSIGVIAGKMSGKKLLSQYGASVGEISEFGPLASSFSVVTPFSGAAQRRFHEVIDDMYHQFLDVVATGRGWRRHEVERVAGGRVWTGRDAWRLGLVDGLGGWREAIAEGERRARHVAPPGAEVVVRRFPRPKNAMADFIQQGVGGGGGGGVDDLDHQSRVDLGRSGDLGDDDLLSTFVARVGMVGRAVAVLVGLGGEATVDGVERYGLLGFLQQVHDQWRDHGMVGATRGAAAVEPPVGSVQGFPSGRSSPVVAGDTSSWIQSSVLHHRAGLALPMVPPQGQVWAYSPEAVALAQTLGGEGLGLGGSW